MPWPPEPQPPCPCCTTGPVKDTAETGAGSTQRGLQPSESRRAWCDCGPRMVCHICAPGSNWVMPGTYAEDTKGTT